MTQHSKLIKEIYHISKLKDKITWLFLLDEEKVYDKIQNPQNKSPDGIRDTREVSQHNIGSLYKSIANISTTEEKLKQRY